MNYKLYKAIDRYFRQTYKEKLKLSKKSVLLAKHFQKRKQYEHLRQITTAFFRMNLVVL